MKNITSILEKEIETLSLKIISRQIKPLEKELKAERLRIKDLERQIETLTTKLNKVLDKSGSPIRTARSTFRSSTVTKLRKQHGLSQDALGKLLGVGLNTVWLWEQGRTKPRAKQEVAMGELAGLSALALKRRLTAVGLKHGRNKPGRKKGSTNAVLAKKRSTGKNAAKKVAKKTTKKTTKKKVLRKATTKKVAKKTTRRKAKGK
ncbi:MAG: helix-turn-helix domain-containing protein [Planctomycetota bacterium]|jgi:DNA-binding transcriptional regulator YiaG